MQCKNFERPVVKTCQGHDSYVFPFKQLTFVLLASLALGNLVFKW